MKKSNSPLKNLAKFSCLLIAFLAISTVANAATYYLDFYSTLPSLPSAAMNPANGAVAISGTRLNVGDTVVFDGVAISQSPTPGSDQWAGIELNQGGSFGLTGAALAVKAETGDGVASSALWLTGLSSNFADVGAATNHVRIVLTATTAGSTTNMTYLAETDPNFTGTFSNALTGSVTFSGNSIALSLASHVQVQAIYDTSGSLAIAATPTNTLTYAIGETPTFSANYEGPPTGVSFQWLSNSIPILGANSLTYTIAPITASNNGDRYAIVLLTNSVNAVTSAPCVLNSRTSATPVTNYLNFYNTTLAVGTGPVNPANGVVAISGTNLTLGDTVVFDGVAISQNPGTGDQWAAINLNAGASAHGVTGATLGVKAETANGTGNSQLFPGAGTSFGDVGATTNHVRIVLTATATGSATNMTYLAETDPNFTGTFHPLTGTVTFPSNSIPLTFGAQSQGQAFYNTSGSLAIAATPTNGQAVAVGQTATFTAIYQGPPASYSYQWLSNNVPIAGATSLTYTTAPETLANSGSLYSVVLYTNSVNVMTSAPSILNTRGPTNWVFNFPNTSWAGSSGIFSNTPVIVSIGNTNLAAGDTVVFDGIVSGSGAWGGPAINAPNPGVGSQQLTGSGMGVLLRFGSGTADAIYTNNNNAGYSSISATGAATNHLRIEFYISTLGSLTNMGWKVLLDQNLTGTYSIIQTGTNLTFAATSLWLCFDSQNCTAISFAQYQQLASTIGYTGGPFTYNGSGQSPTITFSGSTGARTTNYVGVSVSYSSSNAPTNAGNYYVTNTVAADANYLAANSSQAFTINQASSGTTTVGAGPFTYDGTTHTGGSGTVTGAVGLSTAATSLTYSGDQINAGTYTVTAHYAGDANHTASDGSAVSITINQRAITVVAQTNVKLFDGTTTATNVPMLTSGTIATGDTAVYVETYQDANVGTGKTLIPAVTITNLSYGNVSANYAATPVNTTTGVINAVVPTLISAKLTAGTFQVTFTGPNGQSYEVLASTNVATPLGGWVTNSSGIFPGGNVTYTNQSPTDLSHFYRIQSP